MGPERIRLRIFRPADYAAVLALWKRAPEGVGLGESDSRRAIGLYLKRNPGMSAVAVAGKKVVGAVLCGHDGRRGYLHHLVVARRWRGRGIGRALVERSLERLRAEGMLKCNLMLYAANKSGRTFWQKLGFSVREDIRLVQRNTGASGAQRGC